MDAVGVFFTVFFGLLAYGLRKFESVDRYFSVLAIVSYFLVLVPYLSFVYIESCDLWELQLKFYISSLGFYHFSEFIVQSYYHDEEANFTVKNIQVFL